MRIVLLIALLPIASVAFTGTAMADKNSCQTTTTCTFHCHAGDTVYIQLFGPLGSVVYGEMFCGTLGMYCTGVGQGSASSLGHVCEAVVTSGGTGTCYHHQGWFTSCGTQLYAY